MNLLLHALIATSVSPARMEGTLIWGGALLVCGGIVLVYVRKVRATERDNVYAHREAVELDINKPPAQHPMIDTSLCIGCGSCVDACPEGGVLGLVGGKSTLINGLRCVGHGRCAEACPTEAVVIGLGDVAQREDIPRMDDAYQTSVPGVYIVGELSGLALVKNAIQHGTRAVEGIAAQTVPRRDLDADIIVVGAGPAGLAASLTAKREGLRCVILEQEGAGGTILQYPRKKMMLTQPVEIPLYGWLKKSSYLKEELLDIWNEIIADQGLEIHRPQILDNIERTGDHLTVLTKNRRYTAQRVVLALGRRGTPRKLGAPGEDSAKVAYKLLDARVYHHEKILVVGGGDSAVEAAMALAKQEGNQVTLSYRKNQFFRIKKKNRERIDQAIERGEVAVLFDSNVTSIEPDCVLLRQGDRYIRLDNDSVFIFAGGIPPFGLLRKIGIAFGGEPELREVS